MKLLDTTSNLYAPEKAEESAAEMNSSDDWTYKVVHDPKGTGYSFIEIYDENGKFISKF